MTQSLENNESVVQVGPLTIGRGHPLAILAGPCVIEDRDTVLKIADELLQISSRLSLPFVFKASFDKANR